LAQVAGLTTGAASLFGTPKEGKSAFQNITGFETLGGAVAGGYKALKDLFSSDTPAGRAAQVDQRAIDIMAKVDGGGQATAEDLAYLSGKFGINYDNVLPVARVPPLAPPETIPSDISQGGTYTGGVLPVIPSPDFRSDYSDANEWMNEPADPYAGYSDLY
jgi:hypothetical protein